MGSRPIKACDNIYFRCRKAAAKYDDRLNSREGAAEQLGLSVSSLADYELGNTKVVPVDKVVLMADCYNAPELLPYYCREVCPIGAGRAPIELHELDRCVIRLANVLRKVPDIKDELLDIADDGTIDEDERPILDEIMDTLDDITQYAQELRVWAKKQQR
jgi:transcriptional regulator with XRE-family HTH domain